MKTIHKIKTMSVMALIVFTSLFAQAKITGNENESELLKIRKQLDKQIGFPANLKKDQFDELATILFKIDETGKAHLEEVQTQNPELKKFLEKEFQNINIKTDEEYLNRLFRVGVKFKVV